MCFFKISDGVCSFACLMKCSFVLKVVGGLNSCGIGSRKLSFPSLFLSNINREQKKSSKFEEDP